MLVKCSETFTYGRGLWVQAGALYDSSAEVVARFPALFSSVEFDSWGHLAVESATAGPGERRMMARLRDRQPPAPEPEPVPEAVPEPVAARGGRPWTTASKDEWSAYAASLGVDVDGLTKMQLIDAVEAQEAAGGR